MRRMHVIRLGISAWLWSLALGFPVNSDNILSLMLWESGNHDAFGLKIDVPVVLWSLLNVSAAMTTALVHNFIMQGSNNQGTKDVEHKNASIWICAFGGCGNQGFPDRWLSRLGLDQSRTWNACMIFTNTPFSMHLESSEQGASYLIRC